MSDRPVSLVPVVPVVPVDPQLIMDLVSGVKVLAQQVSEVREELRDNTVKTTELAKHIAGIETSQHAMAMNYATMNQHLFLGNGQPSVMHRMTVIETSQSQLRKDVDEHEEHINTVQTAKFLGRAQFWALLLGMVVSAVLALGAILSQMMRG